MSALTREKVLAALEQACRKAWAAPWCSDLPGRVDGDDAAVCYGAFTGMVAVAAGGYRTSDTRRELERARADGLVLSHQSRAGGIKRWWPVGLLAKLQQERAAQTGGAA